MRKEEERKILYTILEKQLLIISIVDLSLGYFLDLLCNCLVKKWGKNLTSVSQHKNIQFTDIGVNKLENILI